MTPEHEMLSDKEVLSLIREVLDQRLPFSLVRVGDGENIILAQDTVMPIKEVLRLKWAKKAKKGKKGVKLPNLKLRDKMAAAINNADVVGIPYWENDPIKADQSIKRPLTEEVFRELNIKPKRVCHTFVNRSYRTDMEFWEMLRGKRIMLVSRWADSVKPILEDAPYELNITSTYTFKHYKQIRDALKFIKEQKETFDIALVSCGVNAVVLCPKIVQKTGKVAIDFGKSLMFMVEEQTRLEDV